MTELALDLRAKEDSFLHSALTLSNACQELDAVRDWLRDKQASSGYRVEEVPLESLDLWSFEASTGDLVHASGKFFRIEGLRVRTNFPWCRGEWEQPIINQPEVGILGILTRVVDGVRYFLIQAKMEPGNINLVQLSPTLQATRSNFTQVHKGKRPRYLEYFLDPSARILVDQLQSEQGARFLRKRNRNMIVEVDEEIPPHEDFRWLTLGELQLLLAEDDLVNMDTRTVLSCIPLAGGALKRACAELSPEEVGRCEVFGRRLSGFGRDLFVSLSETQHRVNSSDAVISWLTDLKTRYELHTSYVPLRDVREWSLRDGAIRHDTTNYFSVIGVDVQASEREVPSWQQPILKHEGLGLVGYLATKLNGVLHFLVQAKVEPGIFDILEMGPTVSLWDVERHEQDPSRVPLFTHFVNPPPERVRCSAILSEEGGRLHHLRNRYQVVELPAEEGAGLELPENFIWMTLSQIMGFVRYNNYFNIEARGLLSALRLLA